MEVTEKTLHKAIPTSSCALRQRDSVFVNRTVLLSLVKMKLPTSRESQVHSTAAAGQCQGKISATADAVLESLKSLKSD